MSLLVLIACIGTTGSMTVEQALDRIDAAGRAEGPLTVETLSRSLDLELTVGENHPGSPFEKVQIWTVSSGVEAHFHLEPAVCFTEQAARDRYGHLFANVGGHRPWDGKDWVAQPDGYRLTLGVDDNDCVRRLGLTQRR